MMILYECGKCFDSVISWVDPDAWERSRFASEILCECDHLMRIQDARDCAEVLP